MEIRVIFSAYNWRFLCRDVISTHHVSWREPHTLAEAVHAKKVDPHWRHQTTCVVSMPPLWRNPSVTLPCDSDSPI